MSTVYLAEQESLGRMVALKVMAPALAADRNFGERFLREARTVAQLTHPNILAVYDIGNAGHSYYLTMEHVPGGDLKQKLRQGALTPDRALEVLRQVAAALGYAHEKGFVHRDVKPENILFREDGTSVLADFGIAKAVGSGTKMTGTGMSIGTPHYMSPEQAQGRADVDGRSDLYSLGVVLYEMLTGQVPYDAENTVGIAMMHVQAPMPTLPRECAGLQGLLDRLLAKDPVERYGNAAELVSAINEARAGRAPSPSPKRSSAPRTQVMTAASAKKGSGLKWAVGGALLAVLVAGGFLLLGDGGTPRPLLGGGGSALPAANRAGVPAASPTLFSSNKELGKGQSILMVASDPADAEVYLDQHRIGTTPLTRDDLPGGQYTLSLRRKFYEAATMPVTLGDAEVVKKQVSLKRGRGKVTVLTQPSGAVVFLDGKELRDRTPLTISGVEAGEHRIKVHVDKFYDAEQTVEVPVGETARTEIALKGGNLVLFEGKWREPADIEKIKEERRLAQVAEQERLKQVRERAFKNLLVEAQSKLKGGRLKDAVAAMNKLMRNYGNDAQFKNDILAFESSLEAGILRQIKIDPANHAVGAEVNKLPAGKEFARVQNLKKVYGIYFDISAKETQGQQMYRDGKFVDAYSVYGEIQKNYLKYMDQKSLDNVKQILLACIQNGRKTVLVLPGLTIDSVKVKMARL
jgi:hypothetical protein